ncbi:Wzt carbohydrate-binding domain-containing protein, partial [Hyalangium sp.]|uniref:Wzt carbohydrate-binding domain-containing protein n=1 Tax=Hyalangium sp. TaxID=2028555 RepID=UPI002D36C4EF
GAPGEVVSEYRRAVELAEQQDRVMVPAAIAADGGALPELEPAPAPAPAAAAVPGVERELKLMEVSLRGRGGEAISQVDTEAGLELHVGYSAVKPVEAVDLAVALKRADGLLVYQTSTKGEGVNLPGLLGPQGTLVLVIERLGLTAGEYAFEVTVRAGNGALHDERKEACRFQVSSAIGDSGVARPVHRWRVESEGTAKLELLPRWGSS